MECRKMRQWIQIVESSLSQDDISEGTQSARPPQFLYHGTALMNLTSIIEDGYIHGEQLSGSEIEGVSLTEDIAVAKWFGNNTTKIWLQGADDFDSEWMDRAGDYIWDGHAKGSVLTFSSAEILAARIELQTIDELNQGGLDEVEWRALTERLPIRFVKGFTCSDEEIDFFADIFDRFPKQVGNAIGGNVTAAHIRSLKNHPLRAR
jgi:hypothetical protein